ncbi:hypothetical protein A3F55_00060 [Candidatus Adlerbacteria bacterium RIFCSPHIGHO2_12_FULL_53_18]|uniref:Uncharacterized protein n=1 Tax=Candidatus Adlerbacteria bacterium RIFCSPHIGHO2_12_FULL_53_18 TaxID=1797242 RepID=A0A1F4XTC9_9BACT|nr:MAG: hypothetical protein A3F55_00060 [Candidatus Adlerbacteria bacterium RIFCSPHIGHO2_12_FULL_53_18]
MFEWLQGEEAQELLDKVNEFLAPYGCVATGVAPHSVGQQGDNKVYGPGVYVAFPPGTTTTRAGELSTLLINNTPGLKLTRVLMEIAKREEES